MVVCFCDGRADLRNALFVKWIFFLKKSSNIALSIQKMNRTFSKDLQKILTIKKMSQECCQVRWLETYCNYWYGC